MLSDESVAKPPALEEAGPSGQQTASSRPSDYPSASSLRPSSIGAILSSSIELNDPNVSLDTLQGRNRSYSSTSSHGSASRRLWPASVFQRADSPPQQKKSQKEKKEKQNMFMYSEDYRTLVDEHAGKALLLEFDEERKMKNLSACIVAIIGILLMMTENFVAWDGKKVVSNTATQSLKVAISLSTIVLLYHIVDYNRVKAQMQIARYFRGPLKDAEFIYQDRIIPFLIEFTICAWHIPPFIDYVLESNPDKWGIFMFFRLYLLIRPMRDFSPVYINRGNILKSGHDEKGGPGLNTWVIHVRMYFYRHPGIFVSTILLTIVFFLSFSICIHEREHQEDFSFGRSLWYTTITMTTVGYGDTVAVTTMGRILAVSGGVLGIILSSFCVAVTSGFLQLSRHQKFAVDWVEKAKLDHQEVEAAALLVQSWWRLSRYRRRGVLSPKLEYKLVKNIIQSALFLRKFRRTHRYLEPYANDPIVLHKLQLEGRFDPILDRVLRVEDVMGKLDSNMKTLLRQLNADDGNSKRKTGQPGSHTTKDQKGSQSPGVSLASLGARIKNLEDTQSKIIDILGDIKSRLPPAPSS